MDFCTNGYIELFTCAWMAVPFGTAAFLFVIAVVGHIAALCTFVLKILTGR